MRLRLTPNYYKDAFKYEGDLNDLEELYVQTLFCGDNLEPDPVDALRVQNDIRRMRMTEKDGRFMMGRGDESDVLPAYLMCPKCGHYLC